MADAASPLRISVLIPSRGRPSGLATAVLGLADKASGMNDVRYVIGCDADDLETIEMALALRGHGLPVIPNVAQRQPSLGGLVNLLAAKCPADVYCSLSDDMEVLTKGWDRAIADAWRKQPDGVWWWKSHNDITYAIVSEKWRAAAGRIFTDYFPFWWDDIWLVEVLRYATGHIGAERIEAWVRDKARTTHRMRDMTFWCDFFYSRREERKEEARRIAANLGWPAVASVDGLDIQKNPEFTAEFAADVQAKQGERAPPTPEYLVAYERAKALMPPEAQAA